jgi:hypothetical protein
MSTASRRGLVAATVFFALMATLSVVLFRPLGPTGWSVLLASIAFVLLGCLALWKGDVPTASGSRGRPARWTSRAAAPNGRSDGGPGAVADRPLIDLDAVGGEPSPEEHETLFTTLAALRNVDLLEDEVDVSLMWQAAQASDSGHPADVYAALGSLAILQDLGVLALRRLVFVPVHVEYDAALLAELTAALLTALGPEVEAPDVAVTLPEGNREGASTIAVPLEGRAKTVTFGFLAKGPPLDLLEATTRMTRADDPREFVCAIVDHYLLYAAIPRGRLDTLNRHFDALKRRVPDEYAFSFDLP